MLHQVYNKNKSHSISYIIQSYITFSLKEKSYIT